MRRTALIALILLVTLYVWLEGPPQGVSGVLFNRVWKAVPLVMFSWAAAILISCGIVDISAGSLVGLLGMVVMLVASAGLSSSAQAGVAICTIGLSVVLYLLVYYIVVVHHLNALICTLAMGFIYKSLSTAIYHYVAKGSAVGGAISPLGIRTRDFPVFLTSPYWAVAVAVIVLGVLFLWRYHTAAGLQHIAVGLNPVGARLAGVSERRVFLIAFAATGVLIALGTNYLIIDADGMWVPGNGSGIELVAIAIAVLGGCRLSGGVFSPDEVALAAILWSLLRYLVFRFDFLPNEAEQLVLGLFILGIPVFQRFLFGDTRSLSVAG